MRLGLALLAVLALGGCESGGSQRSADRPVFNESALAGTGGVGTARKALGEDCSAGRQAACSTELCLKTAPGLATGFFCSRACDDERECPADWTCQAAMPGPHGRLCIPPENWTARAVGVRP